MKFTIALANEDQKRLWASVIVCSFALIHLGARAMCAAEPLLNAHAHNDYWHDRPLFDAIDQGFTSVEADVYLVDGKLLVGHSRDELKAERTLQTLYLEPLARRIQASGKGVYSAGGRFFLLVDFKTDADAALHALNSSIQAFHQILTSVTKGVAHQGAVTIVITGNRPKIDPTEQAPRYFGVDGRLSDLDSLSPAHVMPMISDNWVNHFAWRGTGAMPETERSKLHTLVRKAHAAGRVVRFWGTPESEPFWRELLEADVDLIGTDQLGRLAKFLRTSQRTTPAPVKTE